MNYESALREKLRREPAAEELTGLIRRLIPAFAPPTDRKAWLKEADGLRKRLLAEVFLRGYPRALVKARPRVVWGETLRPDASYRIRKLRYQVCPGYWAPALLYEPARMAGKVPVVLNPNGHHRAGKAAEYKQIRCINLARRGIVALSPEFIGMGELEADVQHNQQAYLTFTGLSGVGLFYLAMSKALDVLLAHRHADKKRVVVTGLSGGGWQTIVLAAMDKRVTHAVPVAGYMPMRDRGKIFKDIGDLEQLPPDMATIADYQDLTAMVAPRPMMIVLNNKDVCFRTDRTKPLVYDAVKPVYRMFGAGDKFEFHANEEPGTHNYGLDNRRAFYRFINKHLGLNTGEEELHRADEVMAEERLRVGLPAEQSNMAEIAAARGEALVRGLATPGTGAERRALRRRLAEVIRLPEERMGARVVRQGRGVENIVLRIAGLEVPVTMRAGAKGELPRVVIYPEGRSRAEATGDAGKGAVFVADILGMGENRVYEGYLELLEAAGERVLGIQVAQVLGCARYAMKRTGARQVRVEAGEPAGTLAVQIAAGLEPRLFAELTLYHAPMSLVQQIRWRISYEGSAGIFCPGLLEVADVGQINALMEGVMVYHPWRAGVGVRYPLGMKGV